ncbi:MAG: tRNA-dihydrouridine synthase [Arsenophonus sp.]
MAYSEEEHPVALQLCGNEPEVLANCVKMAQKSGYDEVNLNIGCPSDRIQNARFYACLMREWALSSGLYKSNAGRSTIPITAKTRILVDDDDNYAFLSDFID